MMTNEFWDAFILGVKSALKATPIILGFILAAAFVIYVMLSF
jgi:hypothetical protein